MLKLSAHSTIGASIFVLFFLFLSFSFSLSLLVTKDTVSRCTCDRKNNTVTTDE